MFSPLSALASAILLAPLYAINNPQSLLNNNVIFLLLVGCAFVLFQASKKVAIKIDKLCSAEFESMVSKEEMLLILNRAYDVKCCGDVVIAHGIVTSLWKVGGEILHHIEFLNENRVLITSDEESIKQFQLLFK